VKATGSTKEAVREFFVAEQRNSERIQKFNLGLGDEDELPPYTHQEYPKALYPNDSDGETIVVQSAKEEREKMAQGYLASLAEAQAAWEAARDESSGEDAPNAEEPDEFAPADQPKAKRSHKKKVPA
jgi:hypothetical protein